MTLRLSLLLGTSWLAFAGATLAADSAAEPVDAAVPAADSATEPAIDPSVTSVMPAESEPATPVTAESDDEAADKPLSVRIADPFVELHTGPGRGFPKFQVVERGGLIQLLSRRTDWFLVKTPRGHEGWVHRDQLIRTLTSDGEQVDISESTQDDFAAREWEFGVMSGEFESASVISIYGAWGFTENLSVELTLGHVMGDFSNAEYATLHLTHQPFPEWWISPYFQLGTGYIQTDPSATIIQTEDRSEQLTHVGVGARTYLTRRFVFRVEYNNYVVLTDRNDNEKVEEWKAGFSLFF